MNTAPESDDPRAWALTVDGVAGVPYLVVMALGGPPLEPWRIRRYGRIEACGVVDYGEYGHLLTVLFEGGAVVWRPDAAPAQQIQKVHWRDVPRVAEALGRE